MTTIQEATRKYEAWMRQQVPHPPGVDELAIDFKHREMRGGGTAFPFLRATFYRWAERWIKESGNLGEATEVLAVGDLHLENFGTWRAANERLVWGINDFDEVWELPWTSDLVRLGVSAALAIEQKSVGLAVKQFSQHLLAGYEDGLSDAQAGPFDLNAGYARLRRMALGAGKTADAFRADFEGPDTKWKPIADPPADVKMALERGLPASARTRQFRVQQGPYREKICEPSGLGSLGRARYCVLAQNKAGQLDVREAKAVLPSAAAWIAGIEAAPILSDRLLAQARRIPDPSGQRHGGWTVRRIAPDAVKITLKKMLKTGCAAEDYFALARAMGGETANIHFGSGRAEQILRELDKRRSRDKQWYPQALQAWQQKVEEDWHAFAAETP